MAVVSVRLTASTGETGLVLRLYETDGTVINTGGDTLTEVASSNGLFQATVTETLSGILQATVETSGGISLYDGWLYPEFSLLVDDPYAITYQAVLASSFNSSVLMGAISTAGDATETFAITINSMTFTVDVNGLDDDGNRTAPSLSVS